MAEAELERIGAAYRRFADEEARDRSPLYEALARGVAEDAPLRRLLVGMPPPKRQPNLLFAAVRHIAGVPQHWPSFRRVMLTRWGEIQAVMAQPFDPDQRAWPLCDAAAGVRAPAPAARSD